MFIVKYKLKSRVRKRKSNTLNIEIIYLYGFNKKINLSSKIINYPIVNLSESIQKYRIPNLETSTIIYTNLISI